MTRSLDALSAHASDGGPARVIDFWSDIGCPWASLAVHRFRKERTRMGLDGRVNLRHRAFPLELINAQGTPKDVLDAELDTILGLEPDLEWLPGTQSDWLYPGSLLLTLEAVQAASRPEVGGLAASEPLDATLRHAFYAESRPIGLYTEITRIADDIESLDHEAFSYCLQGGFARGALFRDFRAWKGEGVQGSPHLVMPDGRHVHNPGLDIEWTLDDGGNWHLEVLSDDSSAYAPLMLSATA